MLRDSKEYYRWLFNLMDDGFCIIEQVSDEPPDFCYVEANPAFIAQSGVSNVVGKTVRQVFPDDSQEWLEICDNILKTGEPQSFEVELVTQAQVLELYAFRIDKVHRRIAVISKGINHCKAIEESYRLLIENSIEMIYLHDLDGKLLEINTAAVIHSGYSKAELLKLSVFDLHPDQSQRDDIIGQWKSWPVGDRVTLVTNHQHKNGAIFPVEVTTGKILIHGEARFLAFARDITDRLAAEERLLRQGKILEGISHFREALACDSEEDAGAIYLQVAKELTDSKMGIMGEVHRKGLKDIVISRPAWDACHIKTPKGHNTEPKRWRFKVFMAQSFGKARDSLPTTHPLTPTVSEPRKDIPH
jgi:PAS domain S-box-containing protein